MKRVIALILICTNFIIISAFAETKQPDKEMLKALYDLEIMQGDENGDLHLGDTITRAEAVKMICVAGKSILNPMDDEMTMFVDVPQSHWGYQYIALAQKAGIVIGDENGAFNPESMITNEEIVKMIVSLIGYAPRAETQGGYPAGYTYVASKLGITDHLQLEVNQPALRSDVAVMIYQALNVPLMMEADDGTYVICDGNGIPLQTLIQ